MSPIVKGSIAVLAATGLAASGVAAYASVSTGHVTPLLVNDATFTLAESQDPGTLDPQMNVVSSAIQQGVLAYDALVAMNPKTGAIEPQLASSWKVKGKTATFKIKSGITCSDGSKFTAKTVVANLKYVENANNKSPLLGVFVPTGIKASAKGSTVKLQLSASAPFLLQSISNLPMVCQKGMQNRKMLKSHTDGTGPFVLTQASPDSQYVYTARKGYAWGPNGAKTSAKGTPAKIVVKIIPNETTEANELLAGQLNAAEIIGADRTRLKAAGLKSASNNLVTGEQWYNEASGHVTADPKVRLALTEALNLTQLQKVITSNLGGPATQLAVVQPTGCTGNSVKGNVPATNVNKAKATLAADGWKADSNGILAKNGQELSLSMLYDTALGSGGDAAAELAAQEWKAIGVQVTTKAQAETQMSAAMFGTGDWDVVWEPLNVNTPDQLVPFLSGPTPAQQGTNFASIDNSTYTADVAKAMKKSGSAGCTDWHAAEAALFKAADAVPFANSLTPVFMKGATLQQAGVILPTSIKMLG